MRLRRQRLQQSADERLRRPRDRVDERRGIHERGAVAERGLQIAGLVLEATGADASRDALQRVGRALRVGVAAIRERRTNLPWIIGVTSRKASQQPQVRVASSQDAVAGPSVGIQSGDRVERKSSRCICRRLRRSRDCSLLWRLRRVVSSIWKPAQEAR